MGYRRAARVDANQAEIVSALEAIGATVYVIGLPLDLLVGYRGKNFLLEVKDGKKPPSQRLKTTLQDKFFSTWRGQAYLVESVNEAIHVLSTRE